MSIVKLYALDTGKRAGTWFQFVAGRIIMFDYFHALSKDVNDELLYHCISPGPLVSYVISFLY